MTTQFKPKLRNEAKIDLHGALHGAVAGVLTAALSRPDIFPFKSCINCLAFNEKNEICLRFKVRPPARVIVFGCPEHDDIQDIPF